MHEWLITRGNAQGMSFEDFVRIFVACNVVLVCEGECHQTAQFGVRGKLLCLDRIKEYHTLDEITGWLLSLPRRVGANLELSWLEENWNR